MHHGQLLWELPLPLPSELRAAHPPGAAAPQDTKVGVDPPSNVDQPVTSVIPARHPMPAPAAVAHAPTATGQASEATAPLEPTSTACTPAHAPHRANLAAVAPAPDDPHAV